MKQIQTQNYKRLKPKQLYIMRGIAGSGKSYIANQLSGDDGQVFSADDFHINPETGKYEWKRENAREAHLWNHERIKKAIEQEITPIIIDNTHTQKWELLALKPLLLQAKEKGYDIQIEEPNPKWHFWDTAFNPEALFERNKKTHNVPLESIQNMINRWDAGITVEDILNSEEKKN